MADLELTRLTSVSPLTKTIHLNPDGSLSNDSSNLALYDGKAARLIVPSMAALASVLDTMPAKGALTLGTPNARTRLPEISTISSTRRASPDLFFSITTASRCQSMSATRLTVSAASRRR